jgi:hypothetical protein
MPEGVRGRPQWGWFIPYGLNIVIHLVGGWDTIATVGASLGLVLTLCLVFAPMLRWTPRLPDMSWGWTVAWWVLALLLALVLGAIGYSTVTEGTGWDDAAGAALVLALVLWPYIWVTVRRRRAARWAALVAAGPLTAVPAAAEDFTWTLTGRACIHGWAVLPNGLRTRITVPSCSDELREELFAHRRVWVAGEPGLGDVLLSLPGTRLFAEANFEAKRRHLVRLNR